MHGATVAGADGDFQVVHRFDGVTTSGDVLEVIFDEPITDVSWVRVATTASPSWVAWFEIEVLSG